MVFLSQLSICRVAFIKLSHLFFYQIIYIGEMGIANAYHGTKLMSNPKIEEVDEYKLRYSKISNL